MTGRFQFAGVVAHRPRRRWQGAALRILLGLLVIPALPSQPAYGSLDAIESIGADGVNVSYQVMSGYTEMHIGESGMGVEVKRGDGTSDVFAPALVNIVSTITPASDTSNGGIASGTFYGGSLTIQDITDPGNPINLLTGNVDFINAAETQITAGPTIISLINASGSFQVTGGTLWDDFGDHAAWGEISSFQFGLSANPNNFLDTSFSGQSKLTLLVIPEPLAIASMAMAWLALLVGKSRRRR